MALKSHIEKKKIDGVKKVEIGTLKPKKGEMGAGIGTFISATIGSLTEPLAVMAQALVELVKLKRSDIRIVGASGAEIVVSGKLKKDELSNALANFYAQEKANVKTGAKRGGASKPAAPPAEEKK